MNLKYRGIQYQTISASVPVAPATVPVAQSNVTGRYRGAVWVAQQPEPQFIPQAFLTLQYRGIRYSLGTAHETVLATVSAPPIEMPPASPVIAVAR